MRASWPRTRAIAVVWDATAPRDDLIKDGLKVVVVVFAHTSVVSKCVHERVNRFGRTCVDTFSLCRPAIVRCTGLQAVPRFSCGVCCPQWLVLKHDCQFPRTFPGMLMFAVHGRICASCLFAENSFDCLECFCVAGFLGDREVSHCQHRLLAANTRHVSCCRPGLSTLRVSASTQDCCCTCERSCRSRVKVEAKMEINRKMREQLRGCSQPARAHTAVRSERTLRR